MFNVFTIMYYINPPVNTILFFLSKTSVHIKHNIKVAPPVFNIVGIYQQIFKN